MKKTIIFYGARQYAKSMTGYLVFMGCEPVCFADKDEKNIIVYWKVTRFFRLMKL
jgi:hypothetical protein